MNRRFFIPVAALAAVLVLFIARIPVAEAQSAGCSAFAGAVGGFLQEFDSRDTGVQPFDAGETIQIAATEDGTSTPFPYITWHVTGNTGGTVTQSGSALSYTFPTTQNYRIVIESTFGMDANIAASCGGGSGGGSGPGPQWSGMFDGRLNPDPAEDYSVFCSANGVDVYVTFQGQGSLLARLSQQDLSALMVWQNRQVATSNGPLIVTRLSETAFRFAGNNGNRAPEFGQKDADLAPCGFTLPVPPTPTATPMTIGVTVFAITATPLPTPSIDTDGDGVLDQDDLCPMYSYALLRAEYKLLGCRDMDLDGYVDPYARDGVTYVLNDSNPNTDLYRDECPGVFGQGDTANGCPDVTTPAVQVQTTVTVDQSQLPASVIAGMLAPLPQAWVNVFLSGQIDACTIVPGENPTTTSNYLAIPLCD